MGWALTGCVMHCISIQVCRCGRGSLGASRIASLYRSVGVGWALTVCVTQSLYRCVGVGWVLTVCVTQSLYRSVGVGRAPTVCITQSLYRSVGVGWVLTVCITQSLYRSVGVGQAPTVCITQSLYRSVESCVWFGSRRMRYDCPLQKMLRFGAYVVVTSSFTQMRHVLRPKTSQWVSADET